MQLFIYYRVYNNTIVIKVPAINSTSQKDIVAINQLPKWSAILVLIKILQHGA